MPPVRAFRPLAIVLAFALPAIGALGCASVAPAPSPAQLEAEIARLEARLTGDPTDPATLRDLGILHLYRDDLNRAGDLLREAASRNADDPVSLFYLGLVYEKLGRPSTALDLYGRYTQVSRLSPMRQKMRGRYEWLTREIAREAVRDLLEDERAIAGDLAEPSRVAVFPLRYLGGDPQYAPLGHGLAAMMTVDLSQVEALSVVERVQYQALLDELALGQSGLVDPETAPRLGGILGAGRIVGGTYSVLDRGQQLRLDAQLADPSGSAVPVSTPGALAALFQVQKALVFDLLDAMGIEPTPAERARIQQEPTQNLQAFLLYSRALQASDARDFSAAAALFQQAAGLDPSFGDAAERAEVAAGAAEAGGSADEALSSVGLPPELNQPTIDVAGLRQGNLSASIGSQVVPGEASRKPAQEGVSDLPLPPPPGQR